MNLFFKYCIMHIKRQMAYPISFFLVTISGAAIPFTSILGIYIMFDRFHNIKGWTFNEVLFTFSLITIGHATSELIFRGFDLFARQVRTASFDRILVRPRSTVLQVLGSEFAFTKLGRLGVGFYFLFFALSRLSISWTPTKAAVLVMMLVGVSFIYFSLMILRATFCFWTVEGIELTNVFIDGGREAMQYPLSIYPKGFRAFFTFVIPFAATNYYPTLYLLGKTIANPLYALSPLLGILFILPCLLIWRYGVSQYHSAGS